MHTFVVTTYGSGDFLRIVFNAVASVFGNDDYVVAMNIAALMGFFGVMIRCAFDRHALQNLRWFIAMIVFYMAVVVPKTRVLVEDRLIPADTAVVANVPLGLAATAGVFSHLGDWLARSFETAFSLPANAQYSTTGMLFPQRVLAALQTAALPEGEEYYNFLEFFKSCVVLDGIGHHRFTWDEVRKSSDLARFFSERTAQNVAYFAYRKGSNSMILPCRSGFRDHLRPDLNNMEEALLTGTSVPLVATLKSMGDTRQRLNDTLASMVGYITGERRSRQQLLVQHALINALDQGRMAMAQELGATAVMQAYALSKAELERKTTYQAMGKVAEEKLPLLRALFEAFLYAIFPIVALMAIVLPTKASFAYVKALVWINLWAPAYALLHFAATYHAAKIMPELIESYNGLSAAAQLPLLNYHADAVATVGYLALSVPMIAWLLVSQSGAMAASFAGRVLEGYDRSVSGAANEAASGDMDLGSEHYRMTHGGGIEQSNFNMHGQHVTTHADGTQSFVNPQSRLQLSASSADSIVQSTSKAFSKARAVEKQTAFANAKANLDTIDQIATAQNALRYSDSIRASSSESRAAGRDDRFSQQDRLVDSISEATGFSHDKVREAMGQLRASAGAGANVGVAKAGIEVGAGGSYRDASKDSEAVRQVADYLSSQSVNHDVRTSAQAAYEDLYAQGSEHAESNIAELREAIRGQKRTERSHAEATREREQAEDRYARAKQLRHELATNQTDGFLAYAAKNGSKLDTTDAPPMPTNAEGVAQLINQAARGDEKKQAQLLALQKSYLDRVAPTTTSDSKGEEFNRAFATASEQVKTRPLPARGDVDMSRLLDLGGIEDGRRRLAEEIRERRDGAQETHEAFNENVADGEDAIETLHEHLDVRVRDKLPK